MNVNPNAQVVLCFGDSNTMGTRPDGVRYAADVRWTGQLQARLGDNYAVIEEGLGGRTTNLESPLTDKPGRDGLAYFMPCIFSHAPLDMILIMLGTNDLKNIHQRSAKDIASVLGEYCDVVQQFDNNIKIVLISPSYIEAVEPVTYYDAESAQKSLQLASEIKQVAEQKKVGFYNAAAVVKLGEDGLHWDEESQARFAEKIETMIRDTV